MSRISDLVERIEKLARKFGMSIEEVVDILEGKHPTHCVTVKPEPVAENPTPAAPVAALPAYVTTAAPVAATAPSVPDVGNETLGGIDSSSSASDAGTASTSAA